MTYQSKNTLCNLGVLVFCFVGYFVALAGEWFFKGTTELELIRSWGIAFLVFAGVFLIGIVIVHLFFQTFTFRRFVIKEKLTQKSEEEQKKAFEIHTQEDEMTSLIELKSLKISRSVLLFGICCAFGLMFEGGSSATGVVWLVLLMVAFVAELVAGVVKIYHYERGIK